MSGTGGEEAPRPRPLSGGLWTLFSWLRREERSSSSDSLSSAGSDRTALSFAFLPPVHYRKGLKPLVVPPPGPPTDSYRKRVQERNLRRQHDRNITLHRKYGLYRSDCQSGYDAFSLPPARRAGCDQNSKWDRERRAASECFEGRVVHVPGKRRAPPPPARAASPGPSTTLTRRTRKRPAPPPPVRPLPKIEEDTKHLDEAKEFEMNPNTSQNHQLTKNSDVSMGCKPEKYSKKDSNTKDSKSWAEKNFLKQIFENKKRNSAADTVTVKVLPSISELDKQAAEIIKTNKQNSADKNDNITRLNLSIAKSRGSNGPSKGEYWFCIVCLRKYDSSISDCLYCSEKQKPGLSKKIFSSGTTTCTQADGALIEKPSSHHTTQEHKVEDKQKLKEMLKEMKDSLPKRLKHGQSDMDKAKNKNSVPEVFDKNNHVFETPTLRIGSVINSENTKQLSKDSNVIFANIESSRTEIKSGLNNNVLITQQAVIEPSCSKSTKESTSGKENTRTTSSKINVTSMVVERKLNTPLKISSLLNPIYIPKDNSKIASDSPPRCLSNSELNNLIINTTKNINRNELIVKPDTVLTTYTPSATQVVQKQLTQESPKESKDTPVKSINVAGEANVNFKPTNESSREEPFKKVLEENCDQEIEFQSTKKKETYVNNNNHISESKMKKQEAIMKETNITSNCVNSNNKTSILITPTVETHQSEKMAEPTKICAGNNAVSDIKPIVKTTLLDIAPSSSNVGTKDHHSQRRSLITQLEQSIAKGDERAAAEAAAKLAQLRLSCSVLSFSSQIISAQIATHGEKLNSPLVSDEVTSKQSNLNTSSSQLKSKLIDYKSPQERNTGKNKEPPTSAAQTSLQTIAPFVSNSAASGGESAQRCEPTTSKQQSDLVPIKVWVEDREAARGPITLRMQRQATLGNLRNEAEASLGLALHLQRWIVGRTLCTDDDALLETVAGADFSAPIYLCLVESEINKNKVQEKTEDLSEKEATELKNNNDASGLANVYTELVQLERQALVPNAEGFECAICMEESAPGAGAVLRDCVHAFCKQCLSDLVLHCEEPVISCPAMACRGVLEEREIRALVSPEEYERWLARGLNAAESGTRNAFHCRTRDCTGWALCDPGVRKFPCPVCRHTNCVPCQAIHEGQTCEDFKIKLKEAANSAPASQTDNDTQALLNTLIKKGEALECPECRAIITKKWGCDWIKCSACKTEICWVTRGRRWGPAGRGDTSAGCRCGVDGKRCHPSCGYCH